MNMEEGEWVRIGRGQKWPINVTQAAMAMMIRGLEVNFRAKK
jgi:hypothetical protein